MLKRIVPLVFVAVLCFPAFSQARLDYDYWVNMGNKCYEEGLNEKGIMAYTSALKMNSDDPALWTNLATLFSRIDQTDKALMALDEALKINPNYENALFNKGAIYYDRLNDYEKAIPVWEHFIKVSKHKEEVLNAQDILKTIKKYQIDEWYSQGLKLKKDGKHTDSIHPLTKAGEKGHALAQLSLGMSYITGRGVEQDPAKAAYWWEKAATQGQRQAQNNLGVLYRKGQGVEQDYAKALKWCSKSAYQDFHMGQYSMGILYKDGLGVPQDDIEAYAWWGLAANQGNKKAQEALLAAEAEIPPVVEEKIFNRMQKLIQNIKSKES